MIHPELQTWKPVPPPKFKKDWPGSLIRVHEPTERKYIRGTAGHQIVPDRVLPRGAVLKIHARYPVTLGGETKGEELSCDWKCPACGHDHRREYTGKDLAEGRIEFVEAVEDGPLAKPMVAYLAAPYTHPDKLVRQDRWLAVSRAAAFLMRSGLTVLSPLSMGHPVNVCGASLGLDTGFETWRVTDLLLLRASQILIVLTLDGWRESVGVAAETAHARELGLRVIHLCPRAEGIYVTCEPWQSDLPPEHKYSPLAAPLKDQVIGGIICHEFSEDEA
jgi:hypothetical protein